MDDLEFRRSVYADPSSKDSDLQQAANDDPAKKAFLNEMRDFDDDLKAALQVKVPENMAQRLILRQTLESHQQVRRRGRVHLALAASVAFAIGISVQMFNSPAAPASLGSHALAHVDHEIKYLHTASEQNTLAQVNAKLARFGGKFEQSIAPAVFANYCNFDGVTSLHLVYESQQGRVSVFVTPSDSNFVFAEDFSNQQFVGKGLNFKNAQITVVGEKGQSIDDFTKKVKNNITWQI